MVIPLSGNNFKLNIPYCAGLFGPCWLLQEITALRRQLVSGEQLEIQAMASTRRRMTDFVYHFHILGIESAAVWVALIGAALAIRPPTAPGYGGEM